MPEAIARQTRLADHLRRTDAEKPEGNWPPVSSDYRGHTIHVPGVLENSFVFMADLVRALEARVVCTFIKPQYQRETWQPPVQEIFFSHRLEIRNKHVLLERGWCIPV